MECDAMLWGSNFRSGEKLCLRTGDNTALRTGMSLIDQRDRLVGFYPTSRMSAQHLNIPALISRLVRRRVQHVRDGPFQSCTVMEGSAVGGHINDPLYER
jgi:hypothetical protein